MAKHVGEPVDPQWAEIALQLDPLPTVLTNGTSALPFDPPRQVIVLAGNYTNITSTTGLPGCKVTCGTRACGRSCPAQVAGDGMMDVMAWPVWPGEAVSLASPESLQQAVRDTLQLSAEWRQGNSFCSIFSQAARVRMPLELWLPEFRAVIEKDSLTNMIVYQGGGGMEVAGALQAIADLMLQSVTASGISGGNYMALFPLNWQNNCSSFIGMSFNRLRGKGAFVVSAKFDARANRLDGAVTVESEVGGPCTLELPQGHKASDTLTVTTSRGVVVPAARAGERRWRFTTTAGDTYTVLALARPPIKTDDGLKHILAPCSNAAKVAVLAPALSALLELGSLEVQRNAALTLASGTVLREELISGGSARSSSRCGGALRALAADRPGRA